MIEHGANRKIVRLDYIDAVKAIAIMMIMMGHITALPNHFDTWLSSCKITTFFVISGFLMAHTQALKKRQPRQFTAHLIQTLAWPYLTFSVAAILAKCFFTYSKKHSISVMLDAGCETLKDTLSLKGIHSMWFLPVLFFAEMIILALYHGPGLLRVIYGCIGLLAARGAKYVIALIATSNLNETASELLTDAVLVLGKSVTSAWFVGFGYILYEVMVSRGWLDGYRKSKLSIGAVFVISNAFICMTNNKVDFNNLSLGTKPVFFVYGGTIGAMGLILLLDGLSSVINLKPLGYWGRNSLIVMCTHIPFGLRTIARSGWHRVSRIPDTVGLNYFIQCFCVLAVLMFMLYGVSEMINKFFPFMTKYPGGRRLRTEG